ncbi:hypothetical protein BU16DRAFT_300750 [Lophium mytilinum]|uniref:C2H2-type domain-containing protein n=1 Tax=Lophium mytilinum TaxID=390894 RepID=A0A6A6R2M9_9PEZI|nr:hypothetical protein BU16DRAFT_300750 [Lophium mytilinum]
MDSYPNRETGVDSYRRRSPAGTDRRPRGSRGRSRSPQAIDRYQPSRDRDDYYPGGGRDEREHPRRRRSSGHAVPPTIDRYVPGQESPFTPTMTTNPVPNPMTLEFQVGFNYFAEWWRMEQVMKEEKERAKNGGRKPVLKGEKEAREERGKEREQIQIAYDEYKEQLQIQMARTFVRLHKNEEWFKERYDPECKAKFRAKLAEFRQAAYAQWEADLDLGVFDDFTLEGIYKNESNGAGGVVEKEEGETTAANEVLGVGDLLPSRGGDLRDENALNQPTLLIKTISPSVSRDKMEDFCKEHLGEEAGGFKWLSLSDPNPLKKCHRIGWVILNPAEDEPMEEDRGDGRDPEELEDAAIKLESESSAPVGPASKALAEINGKTIMDEERGNFTCHVGIHEPPQVPRKKALWDLFSAPERIERDLQLAERLVAKMDDELGPDYDGVHKIEHRVDELRNKGWLQPPVNAPASVKKAKVDEELEEGEDATMDDEEEEGAFEDEVDDEELLAKKKKLDLLIEYLRRVFNFCFFCVFESDSVHELTRKCPGGHLRRPRSSLTTAAKATAKATAEGAPFPYKKQESTGDAEMALSPVEQKKTPQLGVKTQQQLQRAYNWVKTYEDKLLQILEPDSVDIKKLGGKPLEEAVEDELTKHVRQEDESKWRCKVPECTKLFKGRVFWRKHVEKRHPEWFEKMQQDVNLVNVYVLDPAHIAPSRSDANSNGHFPMNNHITAGTPRGFNLSAMPFIPGGVGNGFPGPMGIQAFMNPGGMNMGNWNGMGDDDRHQSGPRRNGGNRFNNRAPGPYDRQQRDGRNQRWNSGRLTPPRGGGRPGTGRNLEGGPGTFQSRDVIPERKLRSYEDLDAVGGSNAELNY